MGEARRRRSVAVRLRLIDPADPAKAQLETSGGLLDLLGYGVIAGFAGLIFGPITLLVLRKNYAALRRLREAGGDGTTPPRDPAILEGP